MKQSSFVYLTQRNEKVWYLQRVNEKGYHVYSDLATREDLPRFDHTILPTRDQWIMFHLHWMCHQFLCSQWNANKDFHIESLKFLAENLEHKALKGNAGKLARILSDPSLKKPTPAELNKYKKALDLHKARCLYWKMSKSDYPFYKTSDRDGI